MSYYDGGWAPYVPVAERRLKAERAAAKAAKGGAALSPVSLSRGAITKTFWGRAWCDNLERYSDYANRLPRGRTYVRNGSVIDLQIGAGQVNAQVMGSSLYRVSISVAAVPRAPWRAIGADCAASIDSLVELLQGRLSKAVMERICRPGTGLFPAPREITLRCSCPDSAAMCKHVAAVLYGVGARLDEQPQLLFQLRGVDAQELVSQAGAAMPQSGPRPAASKVLDNALLGDVFGIEMDEAARPAPTTAKQTNKVVKHVAPVTKKVASITKKRARPTEVAKVAKVKKLVKATKATKAVQMITPDWVFKLPPAKPISPPKAKTQSGKPASGKSKPPARRAARAALQSTAVKSPHRPSLSRRA
jgi:uncharacterized Zn finger protein